MTVRHRAGRAITPVSADLPDSPAGRGLPALPFCVCRRVSVSVRSMRGCANPRKAASYDSTMGGRGQLVLYHHQLRAAGQKPTLPRRNWRCRARRHEVQPRALRLALPPLPAYAGSSARHYCIPARAGNANDRQELEEVRRGKHGVDWQRDFFEHRLRNHHELEEKTSYVLMNPVRKGLCERAEDWIWVYGPNDRPPPLLG